MSSPALGLRLILAIICTVAGVAAANPPATQPAQTQPRPEMPDSYLIVTVIDLQVSDDTSRLQYVYSVESPDKRWCWRKTEEYMFPRAVTKRLIVGKAVRVHWRWVKDAVGDWMPDMIGVEDVKMPVIRPEDWSVGGQIAGSVIRQD